MVVEDNLLRLKYSEVAQVRRNLLLLQNNKCLICHRTVPTKEWCLDHNHETGKIRGVLCRGCNSVEGKVRRAFIRYGLKKAKVDYYRFLLDLAQYTLISETDMIHPKHKEKRK
jgi:hypothetical protein